MTASDIKYCSSTNGVDIAYQVVGDGPVDLVFVSGFITHLELMWDYPISRGSASWTASPG